MKRGILSTVSSSYDPLGLVSPYTIRVKMIFQDECRRRMHWDEPYTEDNMEAWEQCRKDLKELTNFQIPRHYTPAGVVNWSIVMRHGERPTRFRTCA